MLAGAGVDRKGLAGGGAGQGGLFLYPLTQLLPSKRGGALQGSVELHPGLAKIFEQLGHIRRLLEGHHSIAGWRSGACWGQELAAALWFSEPRWGCRNT